MFWRETLNRMVIYLKKIKILGDRMLVKVQESKKTTASGIVLPEASQTKQQIGTVIEIGTGRRNAEGALIPMLTRPGDKVLFEKFAGTEVILNGEEYLLLDENNIMIVLESSGA